MKNSLSIRACLTLSILCYGLSLPLLADSVIFDNSTHDLVTRFNPGTLQVGDEILLAPGERFLTSFSFEYWGANTDHPDSFSGAIQARVQFYLNDGGLFNGYASPGTSFYDSGWFSVPRPTERNTFIFAAGRDNIPEYGLFMPVESNMTWTVQFEGMGAGDSVGVDLYSSPSVGRDYPDYWQYKGGSWALMTNSVAMDFAARMEATIPEPSAVVLSIIGGLGLLILVRRLRRDG